MFYEPHQRDRDLLPHDPFKALVVPRPVGWISTRSTSGAVNLAPYSFFNAVGERPPLLAFSSMGAKDSWTFAVESGEFSWNLATWDLREHMNATSESLERGTSEFEHAELELADGRMIRAPRVRDSPCTLECVVTQAFQLLDKSNHQTNQHMVIGQVVGVHIDDRAIKDGRVDTAALKPLGRCGYQGDYAVVESLFDMPRP